MTGLSPEAQRLRVQLTLSFGKGNGRPLPPWRVEEAARAARLHPRTTAALLGELHREGLFHETEDGWLPRPVSPARSAGLSPPPRADPRQGRREQGPRYR